MARSSATHRGNVSELPPPFPTGRFSKTDISLARVAERLQILEEQFHEIRPKKLPVVKIVAGVAAAMGVLGSAGGWLYKSLSEIQARADAKIEKVSREMAERDSALGRAEERLKERLEAVRERTKELERVIESMRSDPMWRARAWTPLRERVLKARRKKP